MSAPYFSVITPSWNQGKFLRGCIGSVLAQGDPGFEHLIFDNCSDDESASVVREFPHVAFVSEPDRGQSDAVNKGLASASGEIVCWLNSDDEYAPGAFRHLRQAFGDPDVHVVFGDVRQISYDGQADTVLAGRFGSRLDFIRWWRSDIQLHQPAVFFRRTVAEAMGPLREDLHYAMDYEYWWRLSERFVFHRLPEVLAVQHRQPDSKTIRAWPEVLRERERVFSPHYGLLAPDDQQDLRRERRSLLAGTFLNLAYACPPDRRCEVLHLLLKSFLIRPEGIFSRRWLGLLRTR
jgi:glycosyltransferase involved in cell wall biosynthesis